MEPTSLFSRMGAHTPIHLLHDIGRSTRRVGLAKCVLLLAVGLLVALTSGLLVFNSRDDNTMRLVFSSIPKGMAERPIMQNPKYEGVDAHNNPFMVSARQAAQTTLDGKTYIQMQQVNGEMTTPSGVWVTIAANDGVFALSQKILQLKGQIALNTDIGYEAQAVQAQMALEQSVIQGAQGIQLQGPAGVLQAQNYRIDLKNKTARFDGKVFVRLYMQ